MRGIMKLNHRIKSHKRLDNQGSSLIELLISIAIIVIIIVPLMGNFIHSMQMNKKAEHLQIQSNLAASVMEGLKASTITEIIDEYNGPKELFDIIPNDFVDIMRLEPNGIDEYKKREADIYTEQATDYYAIHGVVAGGSAYDVFIKLDAATDTYKMDVDDLNNYPMPEIINLDEEANGLIFSDGSSVYREDASNPDNIALVSFVQQGQANAEAALYSHPDYLTYLNDYNKWLDACDEAIMEGLPTPAPTYIEIEPTIESIGLDTYIDETNIKKYVTKYMRIIVNDTSIFYELEYKCEWPIETGWLTNNITYNIDQVEYVSTIENVYLFYKQSIFHETHSPGDITYADRIDIKNNDLTKRINFFVADQRNMTILNPILIERPADMSIAVFTNVSNFEAYTGGSADTTVNTALFNTYELNRIFDITINICTAVSEQSSRYKDVLYTLESTKER